MILTGHLNASPGNDRQYSLEMIKIPRRTSNREPYYLGGNMESRGRRSGIKHLNTCSTVNDILEKVGRTVDFWTARNPFILSLTEDG